jgi:hypothetical protein
VSIYGIRKAGYENGKYTVYYSFAGMNLNEGAVRTALSQYVF